MLDIMTTLACTVLLVFLLYAAHEVPPKLRPGWVVVINVTSMLVGGVALSPWGLFGLPPTGWPACVLLIAIAAVMTTRWREVAQWIRWHLGVVKQPTEIQHPLRRSTDWGDLSTLRNRK